MKTVLIISPHFPPVNAADMHRIRQSLPYFRQYGWNPIVIATLPEFVETPCDNLLLESIPADIEIIRTPAFSARFTRKFGLGNLGLRSLFHCFNAGNKILKERKIDLIYFSTTMFPITILGKVWKERFKVPFIIDMQDPWRSDHYLKIPKSERPPKFEFAYRLETILEAYAMNKVDGIISVSKGYIDTLVERYPKNIKLEKCKVITFGAVPNDFEIAKKVVRNGVEKEENTIQMVYVGRGGKDLTMAWTAIFEAIKRGLSDNYDLFSRIRIVCIGTSYAPQGQGIPTILPVAQEVGVAHLVREITDRIGYFETLKVLQDADLLVVAGSTEANYTASKIYPYILAQKPLLTVFHEKSSVVEIMNQTQAGECITFNEDSNFDSVALNIYEKLLLLLSSSSFTPNINWTAFEPYTAQKLSQKQTEFFEQIIALKTN